MHLPSNTPQELRTPGGAEEPGQAAPVWLREKPVIYVQQVAVRLTAGGGTRGGGVYGPLVGRWT